MASPPDERRLAWILVTVSGAAFLALAPRAGLSLAATTVALRLGAAKAAPRLAEVRA